MKPYKWHLLVCTGSRCTEDGESEALFSTLGEKLKARGLDADETRVKRTRCSCFAICQGGPIVVVHPDGTWYERVTGEVLDRILDEHLQGGQVVREHVYHQA
ncbi:MAG TPA: (2Fe-2S) ferredoxin domain-containing protein [Pirellulales bacterium]|nr:(2Fe-2S) ferredoxin domain-containing protein [Pirellulales bacterium]